MPETYQRAYGLDFPKEVHPIMVDLLCAKKWREEPFCQGRIIPSLCILKAALALFSREHFSVSKWTEEHAEDYTTSRFCITWGCAASSKSNDYGMFTLLDWITDPTITLSILASTTSDMLQFRSFEAVLRYYRILKQHPKFMIPGKESKTRLAIVNADDADSGTEGATIKASIKGVAVHQGTLEEARANLQGAHMPYTRLILDELSQMREAAMQARHNLSIGSKDFRLFGLCNPDSMFDLACRHSEPLKGWGSIDPDVDTTWDTRWGKVRRHDGLKSPAIKEPVKYPYLIKQADIDKVMAESGGNVDTPEMWTMVRGYPAPQGREATILTEQMLTTFRMREPVIWGQGKELIRIAGLDPAFVSGGDQAIFQPATVGYEAGSGQLVIAFEPEQVIPIKATSPVPAVYQVVAHVLDWAAENPDFNLDMLGVDESGTQRVGDMIEVEAARRFLKQFNVCRVNFGARASEFPVSVRKDIPANKEYGNIVTELWYAVQEYGEHRQIRALPMGAAEEFCQRRVLPRRPKALETKDMMKKRIKHSPDRADAISCCVAVAKWVLRIIPGSSLLQPHGDLTAKKKSSFSLAVLQSFDLDSQERTFQESLV